MNHIEEFFNRVHNTNDGRFGTSGTGGGHFAGRAKGAKRPSLKKGTPPPAPKSNIKAKGNLAERLKAVTEKTATKRKESLRRAGDKGPPPPPPKSGGGSGFPKPTPGGKANAPRPKSDFKKDAPAQGDRSKSTGKLSVQQKAARGLPLDSSKKAAPKRDINAEAKAHVAGLMAKNSADRAARKEANKGKSAAAPKKEEGGDTAKLNDIAKLKAQLKANPAPANKPAAAGPKPAQAKQDAGQKAPASKKVKVPLSERLKKAAAFAKKLGEGVVKDNLTTSQYNSWKKSHDPKFKGERLTVRNTFLTGRQQRNG